MAARIVLLALLAVAGLAASPAAALGEPSGDGAVGVSARHQRAVVTGTYIFLPSGQLRVLVRSNAPRVKLAYRTAAGRLRIRVVRVRSGSGVAVLPRGSRGPVARALATSRLRASVKVRLGSNPLLQDADGDAIADHQYDLDSDGRYELVLFDANRSGRFEGLYYDTGAAAGIFKDANEDGYFEFVGLDADRNGVLERIFYDGDGDGHPELQSLDYLGPDGVADTWVSTAVPSGNAQQDRTAGDLMTRNIVTLNQLRQLNPLSTGYIPYNPAPSLLR